MIKLTEADYLVAKLKRSPFNVVQSEIYRVGHSQLQGVNVLEKNYWTLNEYNREAARRSKPQLHAAWSVDYRPDTWTQSLSKWFVKPFEEWKARKEASE